MWDPTNKTWKGMEIDALDEKEYCNFLDFRHDTAKAHPINVKAEEKAEQAAEAQRFYQAALGRQYRAAAERLIELAFKAECLSYRYSGGSYEHYKAITDPIEDKGYWDARAAIGMG